MTKTEMEQIARMVANNLWPKIEQELRLQSAGEDELITQNELAELLKIHPSTLHGKADIYPHTTIGSQKRFFKKRVLQMLASQ